MSASYKEWVREGGKEGGREGGRAFTSMTMKMLSSEGSLMTSNSKTVFRWYR